MKKVLLLVAFALIGLTANAQLNVTTQVDKAPERVATIRNVNSWLFKGSSGYFISANTDNRFDKSLYFLLGEDAESAITTLYQMIDLIEKRVASTEVQQGDTKHTLMVMKVFGGYCLVIKQAGNAGTTNFTPKELQKTIKKIKEAEGIEE